MGWNGIRYTKCERQGCDKIVKNIYPYCSDRCEGIAHGKDGDKYAEKKRQDFHGFIEDLDKKSKNYKPEPCYACGGRGYETGAFSSGFGQVNHSRCSRCQGSGYL